MRVVNIDVYVSDKKGRPITGLVRQDFELYEDGRPVRVSNFRVGSGPGVTHGESPPDAAHPRMHLALSSRETLWAVLFLDNLNLHPSDRKRVLGDLIRFSEANSTKELRFMLATYDLGLKIEREFSSDPEEIALALASSASAGMSGRQDAVDVRRFFFDVKSIFDLYTGVRGCTPCECGWEQMVALWNQYALAATDRLRRSMNGLAELVSSLGGLPGRKAVFYFSSGLQQRPGVGLLNYLSDLCPIKEQEARSHLLDHDETWTLSDLARRANANRVTLYTIDAGGLRTEASATVDFPSQESRPSRLTSLVRRMNLQSSLLYLADETGGEAIFNHNHPFEPLNRVAANFPEYYSLGFSPSREPDGKSHRITVKLPKRPKARLRFRHSYRDKSADERLGDQLMASLRLGVSENPLGFTVKNGTAVPAEDGILEVPLHITLPLERLMKVGDDPVKALVRVLLTTEDDKGRRTEVREKMIEIVLPGDEVPKAYEVIVKMKLRPGPHVISVGVLDMFSRTSSFARIPIS